MLHTNIAAVTPRRPGQSSGTGENSNVKAAKTATKLKSNRSSCQTGAVSFLRITYAISATIAMTLKVR